MALSRRAFLQSAAFAQPRPNILLILADDLGYSDISPFGGEIDTPNLARLASNGVRFSQFYNCARCCPTRASLLTGLYPHQAGVGHMIQDRGYPAYQGYLNNTSTTLAEALKPAGYSTLMSGKWHVGERPEHWPTRRGFDHYFGLISGASNYFRLDPNRRMALDSDPYTPPPNNAGTSDGFYMTNAIGDHARRMIAAAPKQNPLFMYLAFTSPHWPLHALPEDIERYRGKYLQGWDRLRQARHHRQLAEGIVDKRWPLSQREPSIPAWDSLSSDAQREWDLRMAVYAAQVTCMDRNIGGVLDQLKSSGRLDNTLVLFIADNGGCAEENIATEKTAPTAVPGGPDSFTSYRRPWANASNTPFRLWKQFTHEGGISSPFIASWPAALKPRKTPDPTPAHLIDIMPTLTEAAGAPTPKGEGRSLLAALKGGKAAPRPVTGWEHQGHRALRSGDYKIVSSNTKPWELYDLAADRTETRDLAAADPARLKSMLAQYDAWAARCGVLPWAQVNSRPPA